MRNGTAALSALAPEALRRGVVAATRGNHGLGLAWAGARLGVPVTVCVPLGNNPEKNAALRGLGARLVEAVRLALRATHTLVEGAGAAGLAALFKLRDALAGKTVGIVFSGANIDQEALRRVLAREL